MSIARSYVAMDLSCILIVDPPRRRTPYRNYSQTFGYLPAEITLKKDEPVVLVMHSAIVAHGIEFKELGISKEIEKNKTSELVFTPTKAGNFIGHCSRFCDPVMVP